MMTSSQNLRMAILGAASLLGKEIVRIAQERELDLSQLRLFSHPNHSGERVEFCDEEIKIEPMRENWSAGMDLAVHVAGDDAESHELDSQILNPDCVLIGSTSVYRENPDFPLVVPEINADVLQHSDKLGIIANPCPGSIQLAMVLGPLAQAVRIRKVCTSNLKPVSEYGQAGIKELEKQCLSVFNLRPIDHRIFPTQIAFNCLSGLHPTAVGRADLIAAQTKRLLGRLDMDVNVTDVLLPMFFGQSQIVHIEFDQPIEEPRITHLFRDADGIEITEDMDSKHHPAPLDAVGGDQILLGPVRSEINETPRLTLWSVMDNLRKGAALNIIQIVEQLFNTRQQKSI